MRNVSCFLILAWSLLLAAPGSALAEANPEDEPADGGDADAQDDETDGEDAETDGEDGGDPEAPSDSPHPPEPAPPPPAPPAPPPPPPPPTIDLAPVLPPTAWPTFGRQACPSLQACCVPGEPFCSHPGAARALLAGVSGATFGVGTGIFLMASDSLDAGDPMGALVGVGLIGLGGSALGLFAGLIAPRGEGAVDDRPGRPTVRLSVSPGGGSTIDEAAPYGLGLRVDPQIALGPQASLTPHVGFSTALGNSTFVDSRPQNTAAVTDQESTFPVTLTTHKLKLSAGAELAVRLPYPLAVKRPWYTGAIEVRWKPWWELRRRAIQPGAADKQMVEHSALYPINLGLRWHLSPRQRFTFYAGPRIDWISFSNPGELDLRRGKASLGSFYAEAWWQLDIPFAPLGRKKTNVTGRLNLGYIHSNLDGQRLDLGSIVGYFGPVELSFDLRIRKLDSPVAFQLTAGYRLATGGGAFLELGFVAPTIGKAGS